MSGIDNKVYNRIIVFVLGIPILFLLLFSVVSMIQLREINARIEDGNSLALKEMVTHMSPQDSTSEAYRQFLALAVLEEESLGERYRQGHYSLVSRSFKQYLGFFTGIIMVIVGCVFVLLKLREDINASGSQGEQLKFALATNSPGVVFGIAGAILIGITSTTNDKIAVTDTGLYLTREYLVAPYFGDKGDRPQMDKYLYSEPANYTAQPKDTLILKQSPSSKSKTLKPSDFKEDAPAADEIIIQHPPK